MINVDILLFSFKKYLTNGSDSNAYCCRCSSWFCGFGRFNFSFFNKGFMVPNGSIRSSPFLFKLIECSSFGIFLTKQSLTLSPSSLFVCLFVSLFGRTAGWELGLYGNLVGGVLAKLKPTTYNPKSLLNWNQRQRFQIERDLSEATADFIIDFFSSLFPGYSGR